MKNKIFIAIIKSIKKADTIIETSKIKFKSVINSD